MNKDLILAKLQDNPFLTGRELSQIMGISISTANRYIRQYSTKTFAEKIAHRNKKLCTKPPITISDKAHQIILGSLLGDGSIVRKGTNCLFTKLHSIKQKEYVEYVYNLLKKENFEVKLVRRKGYKHEIEDRVIEDNDRIYLNSSVNQAFNKYKEKWYFPKKMIPDSIFELDALGLAIWFMDDGTSNKSSFYFSTHCFSYEDHEKLVKMMKRNFNIECAIHRNKDKYILYIKSKDKQHFIDLIKPYICPSMNYKIIGHNKQGELLES